MLPLAVGRFLFSLPYLIQSFDSSRTTGERALLDRTDGDGFFLLFRKFHPAPSSNRLLQPTTFFLGLEVHQVCLFLGENGVGTRTPFEPVSPRESAVSSRRHLIFSQGRRPSKSRNITDVVVLI